MSQYTADQRRFLLNDFVNKLRRENPGMSYDTAFRTANAAPEMKPIVDAMHQPADMTADENLTERLAIKWETEALGAALQAVRISLQKVFPDKVETILRESKTFAPLLVRLDALQNGAATTANAGTDPNPARTAAAKFGGLVQEAARARGIGYEQAWQAMKAERPELWAAINAGEAGAVQEGTTVRLDAQTTLTTQPLSFATAQRI